MISKIISGGQTGADQGALYAAHNLGIRTGGAMPQGFRTERGSDKALAIKFNLREHPSPKYPPRTRENVLLSDGTLIFGNEYSPGCRLTKRYCNDLRKPFIICPWHSGEDIPNTDTINIFRSWISNNAIKILNVAGNREERQPGIYEAVNRFLVKALSL